MMRCDIDRVSGVLLLEPTGYFDYFDISFHYYTEVPRMYNNAEIQRLT